MTARGDAGTTTRLMPDVALLATEAEARDRLLDIEAPPTLMRGGRR